VHTGQEILTVKGQHINDMQCVAFSADGKYVASGDGVSIFKSDLSDKPVPGEVKVWDAQTGQEFHTLKGHAAGVFQLAFSPDGKRLASCSNDGAMKVWDVQTGREIRTLNTTLESAFDLVRRPAFSPDGKRLASRGKVWDVETGKELLDLGDIGPAMIVFSPDDKLLASPGKLWDAQTGQPLLTFESHGPGRLPNLAFSPDSKRLAISHHGEVVLWDARTGQQTLSLKATSSPGDEFLAFSSDGHRLGIVTSRGQVTIWDATPLADKR
jgi:WD40 repeat protein